jgi:hypothetical protein
MFSATTDRTLPGHRQVAGKMCDKSIIPKDYLRQLVGKNGVIRS